jgi:pyridoxamine 5'-phosphate oxidase
MDAFGKAVPHNEETVDPDPLQQFERWFSEAADEPKHDAMVLASADRSGKPSARVVLLKHFDERGFVFYTNYESRKGRELTENPYAAAVFHWPLLDRQVRIEGSVTRVAEVDSAEYFRSRPRESQIGAWASAQSSVLADRSELNRAVEELRKKYEEKEIPLPPHWGGFRLIPETYEFWHQGHSGRLHDRLRYQKTANDTWSIVRLAP